MKFTHFIAVATISLASFDVAAAQTLQCQIVSIEAPAQAEMGSAVVFSAKIDAVALTGKPEFMWRISAGTIIAGEGTSSITVDTVGLGGQSLEATVSVSGVTTICSRSATQSVEIPLPGITCGLAFDQYGDIRFEDEKARLDNFAIQLHNFKTSTGYIFAYAGKETYKDEAAERLLRAKDYLVSVRHVDPARIITVDGGYHNDFNVTLIVAPQGAAAPSAMPTLSPAEIEFTKPRPSALVKSKPSQPE